MAAWTTIPGSALVAGQFWSDVKAGAALRNTEASADGATGAPRTKGRALDTFMGALQITTGTQGFIDLDRFEIVTGFFSAADAVALNDVRVRYSNDNGSSYGSYQNIGAVSAPSGASLSGYIRLNLRTGAARILSNSASNSVTHTVPSNCNAFQIQNSSGGPADCDWYCLGGLTA